VKRNASLVQVTWFKFVALFKTPSAGFRIEIDIEMAGTQSKKDT